MQPMILDVPGTIEQSMKWVLKEIFLFFTVVIVGLSAPLLFTVGAEWLAWRYPTSASTWAVVYMFAGPFACTFWMILICHWPAITRARCFSLESGQRELSNVRNSCDEPTRRKSSRVVNQGPPGFPTFVNLILWRVTAQV